MSDVAALAGVSHQTVSRVLNDHPSVRPETRERVNDAIAQLGYRRNSAARALVTRRSGVLGVVTPATALYGPTSTLVGLEEAAREVGWYVSVATIRTFDGESHARRGRALPGARASTASRSSRRPPRSRRRSPRSTCPSPSCSSRPPPTCRRRRHLRAVGVDQRHGARLATQHLLDQGHAAVLHVAGPQDWFDAQDRLAGWREVSGPGAPEHIEAAWEAADGYELGRRLVREGLPSAIFAANDQLALGLLHAFWEAGVRVPADVALVGFDDEVGAAHYTPPLTTVRQDFGALGRLAVSSLEAAFAGEETVHQRIPAELVVRASSIRPA